MMDFVIRVKMIHNRIQNTRFRSITDCFYCVLWINKIIYIIIFLLGSMDRVAGLLVTFKLF